MSFEQALNNLNGNWNGKKIPIHYLKKMCSSSKLKDSTVEYILSWVITEHTKAIQIDLVKSLVRNSQITLDGRMRALRYFVFKTGSLKNGVTKRINLAQELLHYCSAHPKYRLEIKNMVHELQLAHSSNQIFEKRSRNRQRNFVSQESSVISGVSMNEYVKYEGVNKVQESDTRLSRSKEVTLEDLESALSRESKSTSIKKILHGKLEEPWGIDFESVNWLLKNYLFSEFEEIHLERIILEKFLSRNFNSLEFISRFTSKPLLRMGLLNQTFQTWRQRYGKPFLLSAREQVPKHFVDCYERFQRFIEEVKPSSLFLKRAYGLRNTMQSETIYTFIYFVGARSRAKGKSGRYLVVIFLQRKLANRLKNFFELIELDKYLMNSMDKKREMGNCYVKECMNIDQAVELLALLNLEIPLQLFGIDNIHLEIVDVPYKFSELEKRRKFLDFLGKKKFVINKIRERKSDIHCINCNQPLTDKVSIIRGYGPDCWRKIRHLNISTRDIKSIPDVFERYAAIDFHRWAAQVQTFAEEIWTLDRA